MLLDRFIINSDYDSQKEQTVVELTLPVAEFNLAAHTRRTFDTTVLIPEGQYFENVFITNPQILGDYTMIGGNPLYTTTNFRVYFNALRSDATHYKLELVFINISDNQITIPTNNTKARVHLMVAAKQ